MRKVILVGIVMVVGGGDWTTAAESFEAKKARMKREFEQKKSALQRNAVKDFENQNVRKSRGCDSGRLQS